MTRAELTRELAAALGAAHMARIIVEEVAGGDRGSSGLSPDQVAQARAMAARCQAGEPLQYVLGHWSFRCLDLLVDPRVLIPRPETEQVVEVALAEARAVVQAGIPPVLVDAGTGSGAIALSLATELADLGGAEVYATEVSGDALCVAEQNAARVGAAGVPMLPLTFVPGSWLDPLPELLRGTVNLVVSNPPYVTAAEWPQLDAEVRAEPRGALVAAASSDGSPGLADVEAVLQQALGWLSRPGRAVIELAPHQAEAAVRLATSLGYRSTEVVPDLAQRPRALVARLG